MATIIPPTKMESTFRALGYLLLGIAGVWVLFNPPETIRGHLGDLTYVWGICSLTAFIASAAAFNSRYRVEYAALPLTITGVVIYAYTVWSLVPEIATRAPQALYITAIAFILAGRLKILHRLVVSWKGKPWIGLDP